jgi:uncharacterized protein
MTSRKINCRHCGNETVFSPENPFRPFCSERCRLIDLGDWASESYKVPSTNFTPTEDLEEELEAEESRRESTEFFKKN